MTLIVGLNLSDRLYLWADTRLTFPDWTYKDDIIKVCCLSWMPLTYHWRLQANVLSMCVAWDLKLAKYLYQCIKSAIDGGVLPNDIRRFSGQIEDFIKTMYGEWLLKGNDYSNCCLIFWWMSGERRKKIDLATLALLEKSVKENVASPEKLDEVKEKLFANPVTAKLLEKIPFKNFMSWHTEHWKTVINPLIQKAIDGNEEYLDAPDSLIFSIMISNQWIKKEVAERGEFLAYGTHWITKNNFAEEFLARMELNIWQGNTQNDLVEVGDIRGTIIKVGEKNGVKEIWGIVTPMVLRYNRYLEAYSHQMTELVSWANVEDVDMQDGQYYFQKNNEERIRLVNFFDYNTDNDGAATL